MKKRIGSIFLTLTALALAAILAFTAYDNLTLKEQLSDAQNAGRSSQARILEAQDALAEKEAALSEKEAYIQGQSAHIDELSTQISEMIEGNYTDEDDKEDNNKNTRSSYDKSYPQLYARAEYERRYGSEDGDTDTSPKGKKDVYLTFDDGPSELTPEVLDLLDQYNAKATFFVVTVNNDASTKYLSEIVKRGHTLAIHSYSHDYGRIYSSVDAFLKDYELVYDWIYDETGYRPTLFRFPGGSTKPSKALLAQIKEEMERRGFIYYDWSVSSGDGSNLTTSDNIIQNVTSEVGAYDFPVVLMHDGSGKNATLNALPTVLKRLKEMGYNFRALDETMEPVQF